jgi:hypothetical protein
MPTCGMGGNKPGNEHSADAKISQVLGFGSPANVENLIWFY